MQGHVIEQPEPVVVEVTDADFEQQVIEESKRRPVVVDLWASWCGPCKTLGPILEKVVGERGGDVRLAKLDVDANPMTAAAFGVQSIPTVVAFRDGQPVNGFVGAYPEPEVRRFVDELAPSEPEKEAAEALTEEQAGDLDTAEQGYRDTLAGDPENATARLGLARILLERGEADRAREFAEPLAPDPEAERILAGVRVAGWGELEGAGTLASARRLAALGRYREALDGMLGALADDPEARDSMLDLFAVLGEDDELTRTYRTKLASALF
jgi:putative thioredoxin